MLNLFANPVSYGSLVACNYQNSEAKVDAWICAYMETKPIPYPTFFHKNVGIWFNEISFATEGTVIGLVVSKNIGMINKAHSMALCFNDTETGAARKVQQKETGWCGGQSNDSTVFRGFSRKRDEENNAMVSWTNNSLWSLQNGQLPN